MITNSITAEHMLLSVWLCDVLCLLFVGMSTVPEVLVANHCGMEVCGISLITNKCVMDYDSTQVANHEEVLETGEKRAKDMQKLISMIIGEL